MSIRRSLDRVNLAGAVSALLETFSQVPESEEPSGRNAVLIAPPGVGKTTSVPLAILNSGILGDKSILMSEPRRVATRAAATRIAQLDRSKLGSRVGYRMRGESKVGDETRLCVMTERTLVRHIQKDPELADVGMIIFDEFHERSLDLDLAVALALDSIDSLAPHVSVLALSATIDADAVSGFLGNADVFEATAKAFPVETRYLPRSNHQPLEDRVAAAVSAAIEGDEIEGRVLVFLPGRGEIRRAERRLQRLNIPVVSLTGSTSNADLAAVLDESATGSRVILATSVAESSITIPGVQLVIDSGLSRSHIYNSTKGVGGLSTVRSSIASTDQRRGRAGRTGPGHCWRLWDEESQRTRDDFPTAEVLTADLSGLVLECYRWGARSSEELRWLVDPNPAQWRSATKLLEDLGAIDGGRVTPLGKKMSALPARPRIAQMLLSSSPKMLGEASLAAALIESGWRGDIAEGLEAPSRDIALEAKRLEKAAKTVARTSRGGKANAGDETADDLGGLIASAYPDRIAKRRGKSSNYLLANGVGGTAERIGSLTRDEWIVVTGLDLSSGDSQITSALAISQEIALASGASLYGSKITASVNSEKATVALVRSESLGAIELHSVPVDSGGREVMIEAVGALLAKDDGRSLRWSDGARNLSQRMSFARRSDDSLPDVSPSGLARLAISQLDHLVPKSATKFAISEIKVSDLLDQLLDYRARSQLDALAPERVDLGNGHTCRVDYSEAQPSISVRLQYLLGLKTHPSVGKSKLPLKIDLLSPAGRSIQVTSDLPHFWEGSYGEVRKEMRGRYPKHNWPENPSEAVPDPRRKQRPKR